MNLLNRARYPRRQAGQALVEFLAMAAPLLGLFLLSSRAIIYRGHEAAPLNCTGMRPGE